MPFKDFTISLVAFCLWSGTIRAILVEGIMWKTSVKLFQIRTSGRLKKRFMDETQHMPDKD